MSGARPAHLGRRDAVYIVRFRIPISLRDQVGMTELSRSLRTTDHRAARARCLQATCWFREIVDKLGAMTSPTRSDLERAAASFFDSLATEVERREGFELDNLAAEVDFNLTESHRRIAELDVQLTANTFDGHVAAAAKNILREAGGTEGSDDAGLAIVAQRLAARAEREQLRLLIHSLTTPSKRYKHDDALFDVATKPETEAADLRIEPLRAGPTLKQLSDMFLAKTIARGVRVSHITETERVFVWLSECFGAEREIATITKPELREFRDNLIRLQIGMRGRNTSFEARLTDDPARQLKSNTTIRYWRTVQALFAWAAAEDFSPADPCTGLRMDRKKGERKRTPKPFTQQELKTLFATPLYSGYLSASRVKQPGPRHQRGGKWWSGVLELFTGLRAGELAQLLPSDFDFVDPIPHLKVREEDETGANVKSTKNASSVRDVPLAPALLELGIQQFVERRRKIDPKARVFADFRLGTNRASDGMTKFWADYIRAFGLWSEGRATHVFRHTVVACLRANDVAEEDVGAFVGHTSQSVTGGYGGLFPLARKLKTVQRLDYGFDIVAALGGPFDSERHA
jgi:integrase